ncbi:protein tyrosine kinase domain-containing protein [Rhizoctonia solani AG-1 IA]|uniref:Protein tyrosine kinase domain-containing protein n=1 Tax=Thanatephorus cucumeris (strain AG1-IA) TaxID=983506 RepID=L8WWV7_THACA|nr:protein tyrosine kinase domain-containing protein [Rhizoctonia solani AG-1 IA]
MPYSRRELTLSKINNVSKNASGAHETLRGSTGSPRRESEPALEFALDEHLHVVCPSLFTRPGAGVTWTMLLHIKQPSVLLNYTRSYSLPYRTPVVKKVMRVEPDYFRDWEGSRDKDVLSNLRKDFQDRFQTLTSLNHFNLTEVYFERSSQLTLYQEYCENGDLREGKVYMRGETAKLGEFGLSQLVSDFPHLVPSITVGSITRWMCPEYFDKTGPGSTTIQGDVWSFGCTLLELDYAMLASYYGKALIGGPFKRGKRLHLNTIHVIRLLLQLNKADNKGLSSVAHGSRSNVCTTWLNNGTQVAVKMLLPEFGYKEDKTNKRSLGIPRICGFGQATIINPDSELQFEYVPSEYTSRWAVSFGRTLITRIVYVAFRHPNCLRTRRCPRNPPRMCTHSECEFGTAYTQSLLQEVVTGSIPWADKTEHAVFGALMSGNLPERSHQHFPLQDRWANLTWSLLTQCWDMDPAKRPTVAEVGSKLKEIVAELPVSVGRE